MAISSAAFSTFFSADTVSFLRPSSSPTVRLVVPAARPANLRQVRTVSCGAANSATTGKKEPRGIMKPRRVSPEMAELVGTSVIPRTQALKHIWAYIKENNLQDPNDKKIIICDEKLKKIFAGKDRVGFLEIAGLISPHFLQEN